MYKPTDPKFSTLDPKVASIIAGAMNKREAAGLKITFDIPGRGPWSCFASTEAVKAKWIASGARKGWKVIEEK